MTAAAGFDDGLGRLALEMWPDDEVHNALIEDNMFLGIIEKNWATYGNPLVQAITYGGDGGASSTLTDAQSTYLSGGEAKWQYGLYDEHAVFQITNKLRNSMRGSRASMVNGLEHLMDKQMRKFKRNIHLDLFRDHGGSRGRIASGGGTEVLQLETIDDAIHFNEGDVITSADNDGTGVSPSDDADYIRITGIDPEAGTLRKAAGSNWNASGNYADNDYLFVRGTIGAKPQGLPDWLPSSEPTSTLFNNVDRSLSPVKLAGLRFVASAATDGTMANALRRCAATLQRYGGRPTHVLLNPLNWDQVSSELGNPLTVTIYGTNAKGTKVGHIGYEVLRLQTGKGVIEIGSCVDVPLNRAYMIDKKTWAVHGNREPGLDRGDNNKVLRMASVAGIEGRFEAYFNLVCRLPGHNATLDLTPVYRAP